MFCLGLANLYDLSSAVFAFLSSLALRRANLAVRARESKVCSTLTTFKLLGAAVGLDGDAPNGRVCRYSGFTRSMTGMVMRGDGSGVVIFSSVVHGLKAPVL